MSTTPGADAPSPSTGGDVASRPGPHAGIGASGPGRGRRRTFRIFQKLALIAALGNLPVVLVGAMYLGEMRQDIRFSERQRVGIDFMQEVWPVFSAAAQAPAPNAAALETVVEAGRRYDPILATETTTARFLQRGAEGGTRAVAAGQDLFKRIADNAWLSVDPDLSTQQAMAIATTALPEVAAAARDLHAVAANGTAAETGIAAITRFDSAFAELTASLGVTDALNFDVQLADRLATTQMALAEAASRFAAGARLVAGNEPAPTDAEFAALHLELQTALSSFWTAASDALEMLLASRMEHLRSQRLQDIAIAAALMLLVSLLVWLLSRSITVRLRAVEAAVRQMRAGALAVDVPYRRGRDEIGAIARAVEVFRRGLIEKRTADEALLRQNETLLQQQRDLTVQNVRFDAALNNMRHGLAMFDRERRLIVANRRFAEIYALPPERVVPGTNQAAILDRAAERSGPTVRQLAEDIWGSGRSDDGAMGLTLSLDDGRVIYANRQMMADGGWVTTHEDVTERRRAEAQIAHMAHHDAPTLLPNRVTFRERLLEALALRRREEWVAVFCLDLDHFKSVNDTLGHPVGDALLTVVAERLRIAAGEGATVARLSGDEFAIVETGLDHPEQAGAIAERLVGLVSEPYEVDGHHLVIGTSIGIAMAPSDGIDPDILLKNADMALYRAKADGRGTHRYFEPEMDARLQARRVLELDLRKAIVAGEFRLFYQPLINLASGEVSGFEALLRWAHPTRGLVSPMEFIPLAEETGLIVPIGEWVLRRASAEAAGWPVAIKVAVNLSPAQFKSRNLVPAVVGALAASGLASSRLELEITESVLLENNAATLATLHQLRALGVRISMDDFGTGYSSLSYLRSFPFDKIKIDQSFTRDLADKQDSAAIIRAVAGLGHSLGIATTAEGVETARQLELLRAEGCTEVQGYFFSQPRPAEEVQALLARFGPRRVKVA